MGPHACSDFLGGGGCFGSKTRVWNSLEIEHWGSILRSLPREIKERGTILKMYARDGDTWPEMGLISWSEGGGKLSWKLSILVEFDHLLSFIVIKNGIAVAAQVLAIFVINKLFYFHVQSFLLYNQSLSQFCLSDLMNQLDMSICKTPTNVDNLRQLLPGMTPSLLKNSVLF